MARPTVVWFVIDRAPDGREVVLDVATWKFEAEQKRDEFRERWEDHKFVLRPVRVTVPLKEGRHGR